MDNARFDDVIKRLETTRVTRGSVLRGILGGGAAVLLGTTLAHEGADAQAKRRQYRRKNKHAVSSEAVTFDPATGTGFVGKGDVQLALNLNNAQLQAQAASLTFAAVSTEVTEVSWVCTNTRNENTQERARTTETETQGVVSGVARDGKKQITGFNLTGYSGTPTGSSTTEGPAVNSCPTNWVLTTPAGDPVVVSSSTVLTVNGVALQ